MTEATDKRTSDPRREHRDLTHAGRRNGRVKNARRDENELRNERRLPPRDVDKKPSSSGT